MKVFKYLLYIILLIISITSLYLAVAYILTLFPQNIKTNLSKNKTIYIYHDIMHSDIILNLKKSNYNWKKILPQLLRNKKTGYISFGWGDKETYLNTPLWSDLKISTAFKALFINTPSLVHVQYYYNINQNQYIKKLKVTPNQYKAIEQNILKSFGSKPIFVHKGYGKNDIFYSSIYKYNIINTCNTRTGDILRDSNITISYWTPISWCVINSLQ